MPLVPHWHRAAYVKDQWPDAHLHLRWGPWLLLYEPPLKGLPKRRPLYLLISGGAARPVQAPGRVE